MRGIEFVRCSKRRIPLRALPVGDDGVTVAWLDPRPSLLQDWHHRDLVAAFEKLRPLEDETETQRWSPVRLREVFCCSSTRPRVRALSGWAQSCSLNRLALAERVFSGVFLPA